MYRANKLEFINLIVWILGSFISVYCENNPVQLADVLQKGLGINTWRDRSTSLIEGAKQIYELALERNIPLGSRCELYLRIIKRPDLRVKDNVEQLIAIANQFDKNQEELNLQESLDAEVEYESINKLRIFQSTFEDDFQDFIEPELEAVKNDFFDCVGHAAKRHESALDGVEDFINETMKTIKPLVYDSRRAHNRIGEARAKVDAIELSRAHRMDKKGPWLKSYLQLFVMFINNRYTMTQDLMHFMTKQDTLDILRYMLETYHSVVSKMNSLIKQESSIIMQYGRFVKNRVYKDELLSMFIIGSNNLDWLPRRSISFLHQRNRWSIIRKSALKLHGISLEDTNLSSIRKIYRDTHTALVNSCPMYSAHFLDSIIENTFDKDNLEEEKAKWLVELLHPYSLACRSIDTDKATPIVVKSWYIFSIAQKIQLWSIAKLNDPTVTDEERSDIINIMRLIP